MISIKGDVNAMGQLTANTFNAFISSFHYLSFLLTKKKNKKKTKKKQENHLPKEVN